MAPAGTAMAISATAAGRTLCGMPTSDDRRAAAILLALAAAGVLLRVLVAGEGAPGAVAYRLGTGPRPAQDSVAARAARLARPLGRYEKIDVDRAGADELTRLPRIGPALAGRIVADREAAGPFGSLEALDRVPGVGPALLAAIRRHVTFSAGPWGRPRRPPAAGIVTINTATVEELAQLPGIGRVRAQAIVEDRRRRGPFRRLEDLVRVRGIGSATVERLRGKVRVP
ncbi:MAG: hypothetical protein GTO22_25415 [Gemmatimonadales bacterium]|nr:hypothetical protein [Gemmatimonadales bacterium]